MSDEVVERVAQAIADAEWDNQPPFRMKPKAWGDNYRKLARAALSALHGEDMREKIAARVFEAIKNCSDLYWADAKVERDGMQREADEATSRIIALIGGATPSPETKP